MPVNAGAVNASLNYVAIATTAAELTYAQSRPVGEHNNVIYYTVTNSVYRYSGSWAVDGTSTLLSLTPAQRLVFSKPTARFFWIENATTVVALVAPSSASNIGYVKLTPQFNVDANGLVTRNVSVVKPVLDFDFTTGVLDPRITFTRASTGSYYDGAGTLKTAASGVPRFNCSAQTGEALGLLVEESRTNLFPYSEDFSNAIWTKSNASVTADATVAPDGMTTADKIVENTATSAHYIQATQTINIGVPSVVSVFVKAGERSRFYINSTNTPANGGGVVAFNLVTGAIEVNQATTSGGSASIEQLVNGWWRCSVYFPATAVANSGLRYGIYDPSGANTVTYTGDGTSGLYVWGAQLESAVSLTSYIPTAASTVTRAADDALMATGVDTVYNPVEGTFYVEANCASLSALDRRLLSVFSNADAANQRFSIHYGSSQQFTEFVVAGGVGQYSFNEGAQNTAMTKRALAYKVGDFASTTGNSLFSSGTSTALPTGIDRIGIGRHTSTSQYLNGNIRRVQYYQRRLVNRQIQGFTYT